LVALSVWLPLRFGHHLLFAKAFAVVKSDAEWRKILSPLAYRVLREYTEPPFSSPLNDEKRQKLFNSNMKVVQAGPVSGGRYAAQSRRGLRPAPPVHCSRCGGHLGCLSGKR
jgi:peptide-methionine (R)-S-oxide reductase